MHLSPTSKLGYLSFKFNILKLFDLFEYKAVCFMYSRKVPEHLQKFYVTNISDYGLRKPYYYKKG